MQVLGAAAALLLAATGVDSAGGEVTGGWAGRYAQLSATSGAGESRPPASVNPTPPSRRSIPGDQMPEQDWLATPPGADGISHVVCVTADECIEEPFAYVTVNSPAAPGAPAAPTPALSDVARFLAGTPAVLAEPGAFAVVGAPANFLAQQTGPREQTGYLLGQPVTVRFTAQAYHWAYGDGARRTSTVPGSSWQASGLAPFTATPTSHVFTARGSYPVTVTIDFAADYQFAGQPWARIPGTLPLTSPPLTVPVKAVKTVLVGHDCLERPTGPGCPTQ